MLLLKTKQNSYQVENDAKDDEYVGFGCCDYCLIGLAYFIGLLTFPIFVIMSIKIVKEYERAVIMRLGRIMVEPRDRACFGYCLARTPYK